MDDITRRAYEAVGKKVPKECEMTNGDYMHMSTEERLYFNGYVNGANRQLTIDYFALKECFVFTKEQLFEHDKSSYTIYKRNFIKKALEVYSDFLSANGCDLGTINSEIVRMKKSLGDEED